MAQVFRKYTDDVIRIKLYYGYDMPDSDTIASVTASVAGEDDQDLTCTVTASGQVVTLVATAGTPEGIYQVYVTVVTATGLHLTQQIELAVRKGVLHAAV